MVYKVPNTKGMEILIDDIDRDLLPPCGRLGITELNASYGRRCYAIRRYKGRPMQFHRLVMERILGRPIKRGEHTDHINNNSLDNRRENLRVLSHHENVNRCGPRLSRSTHGFKGVVVYRSKKETVSVRYEARLMLNGKTHRLGRFKTPEEAARVYDTAALKYFGPLAYQNFKQLTGG